MLGWREACGSRSQYDFWYLSGCGMHQWLRFWRFAQSQLLLVSYSPLAQKRGKRGPYLSPGRIQPPGRREDSETYHWPPGRRGGCVTERPRPPYVVAASVGLHTSLLGSLSWIYGTKVTINAPNTTTLSTCP